MKFNLEKMGKVIPALLAPFSEDRTLNENSMREHVEFLINKGIGGLYLNGSTGEGFLMKTDERMRVLEVVTDQVKGRITVINHVGTIQMEEAVKMAKHSEEYGADAVASVTPYYYSFSVEEIKDYYNALTGCCNLPLFVYNVPATTGFSMSYDLIREMAYNHAIIGVKYTSYNHYEMMKIKEINNGNFIVFSGADEMCLSGLIAGADALIGSFYNIIPELYVELVKHFENGRIVEARKLFAAGNDIIRLFLKYPLHPAMMQMLKWRGLQAGLCKKPFRELTHKEAEEIRKGLADIEEVRNTGLEFFNI